MIMVLGVWCLFANEIVTIIFIPAESKCVRDHLENYPLKDKVITVVASESPYDDIFEFYSISGGAFISTENNENRKIKLLLKSESRVYSFEAINTVRADVYQNFTEKYNLTNADVGFLSEFSTVNIANDIYELFIYVQENEQTYGLARTGYKYQKDKTGFHTYSYGNVPIPSSYINLTDLTFRIDKMNYCDNSLYMSGWQVTPEKASIDTMVYGCILDSNDNIIAMAEMKRRERIDIANVYGMDNLLSGFQGNINIPSLSEDYHVTIMTMADGEYFKGKEYETLEFVSDTLVNTHQSK